MAGRNGRLEEGNEVMKWFYLVCAMAYSGIVWAEADVDPDPWQGLNRAIHEFNETADKYFLKPVARGYDKVTPNFVRRGVGNFFSNLDDVDNLVNNLLQGKVGAGASDLARLVVNTTIGLGGILDPASSMGLEKHEEDFGQTFSVWGLPRGPYLVIPFLGPSTVTDALGRPVNSVLDPLIYLHPVDHRNRLIFTRVVDDRATLLSAERAVFGDRYIFIRDAYLQRRDYLINDGEVDDPFADDF